MPEPTSPQTITWQRDQPSCEDILSGSSELRIIKANGISIALNLHLHGPYIVGELHIANQSKRRKSIVPSTVRLVLQDEEGENVLEVLSPLTLKQTPDQYNVGWLKIARGVLTGLLLRRNGSLSETVLSAGQSVAGILLFRNAPFGLAVFRMLIDGTIYEFVVSP